MTDYNAFPIKYYLFCIYLFAIANYDLVPTIFISDNVLLLF